MPPSRGRLRGGATSAPRPASLPFRRSLPSHLLWRSALGGPAARSGSSSRGVYLLDPSEVERDNADGAEGNGMTRNIITDVRMFRLPRSLRDAIVYDDDDATPPNRGRDHAQKDQEEEKVPPRRRRHGPVQLLSHPRVVGAAPPSRSLASLSSGAGVAFARSDGGVRCMDLDRGNDDTLTGSPPRYLLVGSGGGDCSVALYDLSYFGSDECLYQRPSSSTLSTVGSARFPRALDRKFRTSSVTHRPIARSLRRGRDSATSDDGNAGGAPSGHRHPLLGVRWYPADVRGAFVSTSISGEILIWDAHKFVPVFATHAHVFSDAETCGDGESKAVAPLRCMDLPATPEGCPHGAALLALGLGGGAGRYGSGGAIRLCDAFRGGSATHELVGHDGGVNDVAWDPAHPFRLASAGEDRTVRLWDVRKSDEAACLGVLDRYGDMNGGRGTPPGKRFKSWLSLKGSSPGVESHGGPVTSLSFLPDGNELVSAGQEGKIQHWDLRPESCFAAAEVAIRKRSYAKQSGGGMDPVVATGSRLLPARFAADSAMGRRAKSKFSGQQSAGNHASLAIIQPGSRSTATILSTACGFGANGQVAGYSLYGRRDKGPGGRPDYFIIEGHLADVTCLVPVMGAWDDLRVSRCDDEGASNEVQFLTGGRDGMVLSWGRSRPRGHSMSERDEFNEGCRSLLGQRNFIGGNRKSYEPRWAADDEEEELFEDADSW